MAQIVVRDVTVKFGDLQSSNITIAILVAIVLVSIHDIHVIAH